MILFLWQLPELLRGLSSKSQVYMMWSYLPLMAITERTCVDTWLEVDQSLSGIWHLVWDISHSDLFAWIEEMLTLELWGSCVCPSAGEQRVGKMEVNHCHSSEWISSLWFCTFHYLWLLRYYPITLAYFSNWLKYLKSVSINWKIRILT